MPLACHWCAHRLAELQGVLGLTDLLASLLERYGARSVLGLRGALQQLRKAALDGLHTRSLSKLTSERVLGGQGWILLVDKTRGNGWAAPHLVAWPLISF